MEDEGAPVPEVVELEDWNIYAETMQRRALARLLGLALRELVEGRLSVCLRLLKVIAASGPAAELGKQEFVLPLQHILAASPSEVRQELEQLRVGHALEQFVAPLTGRR